MAFKSWREIFRVGRQNLLCLILSLYSISSFALDLELTQGISSALPIGLNSFGRDENAQHFSEIIQHDLKLSGQFKLVSLSDGEERASWLTWKEAGADSLLNGEVKKIGMNHYEVNVALVDTVAQGRVLLKKNFQVNGSSLRALAHHVSDLVYEKLTGERGIFSTRIAYVLVQRSAGRSRYSLEIADADGFGPQSLLVSSEPIMSPSWSPDGHQIAYVSFEKKKSQIYTVAVESGKRRLITDFAGINGAPTWSPDGKQLAVVLSKGGNPKIYSVDLATGALKQLTFGNYIDTEPRFAPDGKSLLFTSGRGGSPQVYKLSLSDGAITRLSYEGNYNARAIYTPNQKQIVLFHREENSHFSIAVQEVDTGVLSSVTFAALDESPSVSPNGRLIIYATRHNDQGVLGIVSIDGRIRMRLPARDGDVQEPAWSPYLS